MERHEIQHNAIRLYVIELAYSRKLNFSIIVHYHAYCRQRKFLKQSNMEKKNIYSIIMMVIMVIGIVLTYNSWELWKGWLIIWAMVLTLEILVLGALIGEFIKQNLL